MKARQFLFLGASALALFFSGAAVAEEAQEGQYVRIAELEIDPAQLENFKSAMKEGIETAVRIEPGVLALYAVSAADNPAHIKIFEVYTDANAYKAHLETAHFMKFRATTDQMVISRKLADAVPIILSAKTK